MNYKVTCKNCKAQREIKIIKSDSREIIDWLDNNPDPNEVKIISGRKRFDNAWGWQCICGNDDISTKQERQYIRNPRSPHPQDVAELVKNLKIQKPKFVMETI